jgi:tetrahydromethanopterin S-methyltransferase subunit D
MEGIDDLMALLVWFTMGIALWHFTVFLPDRFWQGIIGAFLGAVIGAVVFGALVEVVTGRGLGQTDVLTALTAIPGVAIGLAVIWAIGVRAERQPQ